jgi:glycosyltransferase involved in cell wall biosynthesis
MYKLERKLILKNILYLNVGAELYGADVILLELVKNLDKSKFKPYVILPCDGPLILELKKLGIEVQVLDYPVLRRQYFNPKGLINYIFQMKKAIKELESFCRFKNIDIIHTNTAAILEGGILYRKLKIKHLWHLHEMLDKPKILYKFLSYFIPAHCTKVLAVSNSVKDHWNKSKRFYDYKKGEHKIIVVHNGIDLEKFNPQNECEYLRKEFNLEVEHKVVGMIGRVNAIKGQDVFIEAMEKVMENISEVKALLVGGVFKGQEWRMEALKERISKSKYKDNFIVCDYRKDSPNLHCIIDVFALPSISFDSFPTTVLEAMASAKPIVAFKSGGVVEMVKEGENGFFADFGDSEDLAKKILLLLQDEALRNSFGKESNRIMLENFSVSSFVSKVEEVYLNL